ncbi:MAG: glycosyltransferase [Bacteroidetes bacterium]|nr:MAG: glycosyltransferase [Bacteroidota bacterium]MBL1145619.1 glycosyltransferase [Bacteroidota bacterium]NOG58415.1 glycosyltransferase [Bacteroidota bacterium]
MIDKPNVLIFIDWFYPAFKAGGPIKSVFNMAEALKEEYAFHIVTSNLDEDGSVLDVIFNQWTEFSGFPVIYLNAEKQKNKNFKKLLDEVRPVVIYYNSLFSKNFTLIPYLLFKKESIIQLIAPRGMLGKGALAIKPLKKSLFLQFAKCFIFSQSKTYWHATSEQEAKEIKAALGTKTKIKIAQNLSSPIVRREHLIKEIGELKLVFISRLALKKNLLFALELMQKLQNEMDISLDIYGPIEEENYWEKCKAIIEKDNRIHYKGILAPHEITPTLQQYHFYILPTLHENYGHSIVEAIVCGVPVIISKNTPWLNINQNGIGADLPLDELNQWELYLRKIIELSQAEYDQMVKNCLEFSKHNIVDKRHRIAAIDLFKFNS